MLQRLLHVANQVIDHRLHRLHDRLLMLAGGKLTLLLFAPFVGIWEVGACEFGGDCLGKIVSSQRK